MKFLSLPIILLCQFLTLVYGQNQTFLPYGDPVREGLSREGLAKLSTFLETQTFTKKIPGTVTLIVRHGKVVYQKASGKANLETGEQMRMDHLFRMASMTKFITTVAALKLFDEGLFTMDTPLEDILPEFTNPRVIEGYDTAAHKLISRPAKNRILMKHVFTHTSGIVYPMYARTGLKAYLSAEVVPAFVKPNRGVTLQAEINHLAKLPLAHEPGEGWTYGMNMDVLGRVIEVLDGRSLPEFIREEIFKPLRMNRSWFGVPMEEWKNMTQAYTPAEKGFVVYDDEVMRRLMNANAGQSMDYWKATNTSTAMGGADMVSCVQDYARFLQMIMNKGELDGVRILSKRTVDMLERPLFDVHSDEAVAKSFIGSEQVQAGMSVVHVPKAKTDFGLLSPGSYFWGGYFNTLFTVDRNENMFILLLSQVAPDQSNHHNKARHLAWASIVD